jgi:hypothetical protein
MTNSFFLLNKFYQVILPIKKPPEEAVLLMGRFRAKVNKRPVQEIFFAFITGRLRY